MSAERDKITPEESIERPDKTNGPESVEQSGDSNGNPREERTAGTRREALAAFGKADVLATQHFDTEAHLRDQRPPTENSNDDEESDDKQATIEMTAAMSFLNGFRESQDLKDWDQIPPFIHEVCSELAEEGKRDLGSKLNDLLSKVILTIRMGEGTVKSLQKQADDGEEIDQFSLLKAEQTTVRCLLLANCIHGAIKAGHVTTVIELLDEWGTARLDSLADFLLHPGRQGTQLTRTTREFEAIHDAAQQEHQSEREAEEAAQRALLVELFEAHRETLVQGVNLELELPLDTGQICEDLDVKRESNRGLLVRRLARHLARPNGDSKALLAITSAILYALSNKTCSDFIAFLSTASRPLLAELGSALLQSTPKPAKKPDADSRSGRSTSSRRLNVAEMLAKGTEIRRKTERIRRGLPESPPRPLSSPPTEALETPVIVRIRVERMEELRHRIVQSEAINEDNRLQFGAAMFYALELMKRIVRRVEFAKTNPGKKAYLIRQCNRATGPLKHLTDIFSTLLKKAEEASDRNFVLVYPDEVISHVSVLRAIAEDETLIPITAGEPLQEGIPANIDRIRSAHGLTHETDVSLLEHVKTMVESSRIRFAGHCPPKNVASQELLGFILENQMDKDKELYELWACQTLVRTAWSLVPFPGHCPLFDQMVKENLNENDRERFEQLLEKWQELDAMVSREENKDRISLDRGRTILYGLAALMVLIPAEERERGLIGKHFDRLLRMVENYARRMETIVDENMAGDFMELIDAQFSGTGHLESTGEEAKETSKTEGEQSEWDNLFGSLADADEEEHND